MARPLKRTVDYFPHFVQPGKTLLIIENEFGNDGYAFWFKLLSLLCKTDGQVYDYNNSASWRLLLAETRVSEDIANKILQLLAEVEAIDSELHGQKIIWVQHLVDNLAEVFVRRRNGSVPERPVIANINRVSDSKNTQTRLDHTKGKKTKGKKTKANKPYGEFNNVLLSDDEYQKLQARFGASLPGKIEALSLGIESKGYKYESHYATILSWARRDEKGGLNGIAKEHIKPGVPGNRPAGALDSITEGD